MCIEMYMAARVWIRNRMTEFDRFAPVTSLEIVEMTDITTEIDHITSISTKFDRQIRELVRLIMTEYECMIVAHQMRPLIMREEGDR